MVTNNQLDQVIDALYKSILDPEYWLKAVGLCGQYVGGVGAMVTTVCKNQLRPVSTVIGGAALPRDMADNYANNFIHIDPHHKKLLRGSAIHEWYCSHQSFDKNFVERDAFYQEFLIPQCVRYLKFAIVDDNDDSFSTFMVMRLFDQQPFGDASKLAAQHIGKHLQNALSLNKYIQGLQTKIHLESLVIDALGLSMLIVDSKGTIVHLNAHAERFLANPENGLTCNASCLATLYPDDYRLLDLITSATRFPAIAGGMILKGKVNRQLLVTPLSVTSLFTLDWQVPVALILVSEAEKNVATLQLIGKLYDLSPAELRVAAALLSGKPMEEYAQGAGVTLNTVHTQLSHLFKKTGTCRQSELVALLGQVPALYSFEKQA